MLRQQSAFVQNGTDLLLLAANNAKKFAQRRHNFEMNRLTATVVVDPVLGGDLATAVEYQTTKPVVVKSIERAYLQQPQSGQVYPLHIVSRAYEANHARRALDSGYIDITIPNAVNSASDPMLIRQNNQIFFSPSLGVVSAPLILQPVYMDIVKWMPDYGASISGITAGTAITNKIVVTGETFITKGVTIGDIVHNTTDGTSATVIGVDSQTTLSLTGDIFIAGEGYEVITKVATDFLLENCNDFMLYRSVVELNFFLKDDSRVQISQSKMSEVWESVLSWDNSLVENTAEDANLD
jgi:hypothetical protein